jgi:4-amino-4-deoxy-L-arabinose transferase-like glycosyltransferase
MNSTPRIPPSTSPGGPASLWMLYPLFFVFIYLSHWTLLRLPYFWDEAGYYIPAAWDFFRTGTLIPITTLTNAHPPLPSILLAAWWHLSGFLPSGTRTLICLVAAAALLAVFRIARTLLGTPTAIATTLLTALYPIWFVQSTLAHADIFAAAFTLWALTFYLDTTPKPPLPPTPYSLLPVPLLFSLAALSKETAIVTPLALALYEAVLFVRAKTRTAPNDGPSTHSLLPTSYSLLSLLFPTLPLIAWYAYHYHHTGFVFGNPEYLRYNATANLDPHRIALSLYHRLLHLIGHMNMYVPVLCAVAAHFMPAIPTRPRLTRTTIQSIAVILIANWLAFSVLGGALLTRYLLPMFPLVLLLCVAEWQRHLRPWYILAALSAAAFLSALWIPPLYAYAPEDNLTYRDFVVLHQRAIAVIAKQYPLATVLTAWPATTELQRPELGYTHHPVRTVAIDNFSYAQIQLAATDPGAYDTALIFSTKIAPPPNRLHLFAHPSADPSSSDARYFDFHDDLSPEETARLLHGAIVWRQPLGNEWAAILRFPRIQSAAYHP